MPGFDELLVRGTAVVDRGEDAGRGTAFRVAPRYAVTAGHVVDDGLGGHVANVELDFGAAGTCTASVVATSKHPGVAADGETSAESWPYPDLAVLELPEDACPDAPCVLMTEVVPEQPELRVAGMAVPFERIERVRVASARYDGWPERRFVDLGRVTIRPGHSGGPVLSVESGAVFGVVKGSAHTVVEAGGIAAPLLAGLRAVCADDPGLYLRIVTSHDRYHAGVGHWVFAQRAEPEAARRLEKFVDVVALLASIGEPADREGLARLHDELRRDAPDEHEADYVVAWRDFAEFLVAEAADGYALLRRMCVELPAVVDVSAEVEARLETLAGQIPVPGLGWSVPRRRLDPADGHRTLIGVISTPPNARQREVPHRAELYRVQGSGEDQMAVPVSGDAAVSAADFPAAKSALQQLFNDYLGHNPKVRLEIALPDDQLGVEDPHAWRRGPDDPRRFSSRYRMDLRRTATFARNEEQRRDHREHWAALDELDAADGLGWLECRENRDRDALQGYIEEYHGVGVLGPPNVDILYLADLNAMPILLWRRNLCADHGCTDPCSGRSFRDALCRSFDGTPATRWADRVDEVRRGAAKGAPAIPDGSGWQDIVYLIERPGHHKRLFPMAGPHQYRGGSA